MSIIGILAMAVLVSMAALYGFLWHKSYQKPHNCPLDHLKSRKSTDAAKVIVCIGDSITHGRVSSDYTGMLASRFKDAGYSLVNAGVNDQLAFNVLSRVNDIAACDPSFITILIGTNDVRAGLSPKQARWARKHMKLPQKPDEAFFIASLSALCAALKARTRADIALLSLPPLGEDASHAAFARAAHYSRLIKNIAAGHDLVYLPLNERMTEYLQTRPNTATVSYDRSKVTTTAAVFRHIILHQSFDHISSKNGYHLLTDSIHLNSRASEMICDLIEPFIS